jgi:hypothetical protein
MHRNLLLGVQMMDTDPIAQATLPIFHGRLETTSSVRIIGSLVQSHGIDQAKSLHALQIVPKINGVNVFRKTKPFGCHSVSIRVRKISEDISGGSRRTGATRQLICLFKIIRVRFSSCKCASTRAISESTPWRNRRVSPSEDDSGASGGEICSPKRPQVMQTFMSGA